MRLLVVSDTHGDENALWQAVEEQPSAHTVIHLGDGVREAQAVAERYPERTFYLVRGNGDWSAGRLFAVTGEELLGGRRVFFTHGHLYEVKSGLRRVIDAARERQAALLLFGHTHTPLEDYDDGLYIFNPGSLADGGTYGVVDLTPAGIVLNTVRLRH